MAATNEQTRKDLQGGIRFLEAVDRAFPGKIEPDLLQALRGAEEHPVLLDLITQKLTSAK